jgi:hypothetical protein
MPNPFALVGWSVPELERSGRLGGDSLSPKAIFMKEVFHEQ